MNNSIKKISCDVLVVGSGAAGLRCAIEAFERGTNVLIVGKSRFGDAHTKLAAGGINAALAVQDKRDSWQVHAADTFEEGGKIANPEMVEVLAKNAPQAIWELLGWGVSFARSKEGKILQRVYGAQTYPRTCYVGDYTGRAILGALVKKTKKLGIKQMDSVYITQLFKKNGQVAGCFGIDFKRGEFVAFFAKSVVIAMGGYSRLYKSSSSRQFENMGYGCYLALKNGLALVDMEMVQFHPTGMTHPPSAVGKLVTEAVRSEGAKLFNAKEERLMQKYSPKMLELSARDVVARAVFMEIFAGRGTKNRGVWLDVTHVPLSQIMGRLPDTWNQFKKYQGLDISKQRMEVSPTAHYSMGGVAVDPADTSTELVGLFACGEVTGGLHGGNRLGGNSLAETIVFGKIAGKNASDFAKQNGQVVVEEKMADSFKKEIESLFKNGSEKPQKLRAMLQETMWECAGVIRDGKKLKEGLVRLKEISEKLKSVGVKSSLKKNNELVVSLDLISLVLVGKAVLESALLRTESRAAHYRSDFTKTTEKWRQNIFCRLEGGKLVLSKKPVPKGSSEFEETMKKHFDRKFGLWE